MAQYTSRDGGGATTFDPGKTPARILSAQHPLFRRHFNYWIKLIDLAEGENLGRYIDRHTRESRESHIARVAKISYRNYVGPIIDLYCHYIFSKQITRMPKRTVAKGSATPERPVARGGQDAVGVEWQEEFLKNVDRQGATVDRYMREVAFAAFCFGMVHVLVDLPRVRRLPKNEAERKEMGLRPYFTTYYPTETTNWQYDDEGNLEWIRFREPPTGNLTAFDTRGSLEDRGFDDLYEPQAHMSREGTRSQGAPKMPDAVYRTFDREGWYIHKLEKGRAELVDAGSHPENMQGRVPVVTFFRRRKTRIPTIGMSLVHDISGLNKDIMNLDSLITEAVCQQTLNILVLARQAVDGEEIVLGVNNVLEYSGDRPPFFLTPSTAPVQFMEGRVQGLREEIYRLAKLGGGMGLEPRTVPSGVAASFEFNETNRTLAEHADQIENGEHECHELWFRYFGVEFDGVIDYPDDFAVQSFQEELQEITQAATAIRSPRFRRELEKQFARRRMNNAQKEVVSEIEREIDFIPDAVSTFGGPIYFDNLTQEVKLPGQGDPIGNLAEMLDRLQQEMGVDAPPDPNNPDVQAERQLQQQVHQQEVLGPPEAPGATPPAAAKGGAKKPPPGKK